MKSSAARRCRQEPIHALALLGERALPCEEPIARFESDPLLTQLAPPRIDTLLAKVERDLFEAPVDPALLVEQLRR